ncbi:MAG: Nif3-like dinuclear metal center hexameric protein [Candidatus Thorarchaeota archaeon]
MTTLLDIVKYFDTIAPPRLVFKGLENRVEMGPQSETEQEKTTINRIVIATYPSGRVVTKASQDKANLLITHRPLFPFAIDRISGQDLIRIRLLTKNYISSYTLGGPWICARDGIGDALVETLGLDRTGDFIILGDLDEMVPAGRICNPPSVMNHSRFANYLIEKLGIDAVTFSGDLDNEVGQVLVFPGSHVDVPEIIQARKLNVRTLVTGEVSPDVRLLGVEEGLHIFEMGAFVTEEPGMRRLRHQFSLEFPDLKVEFVESLPLTKSLSQKKNKQ